MKKTIIEEGIYNINTRESVRKAIFTCDGSVMTRQLIGYDGGYSDDKIDRISNCVTRVQISLKDTLQDTVDYEFILNNIKNKVESFKNAYQENIDKEIPFFDNPIIIEE